MTLETLMSPAPAKLRLAVLLLIVAPLRVSVAPALVEVMLGVPPAVNVNELPKVSVEALATPVNELRAACHGNASCIGECTTA